jgi:signal transduction histidine kinase
MAEISVRDTGVGIPAEKLHRIFEPFFSTKDADEQGQGGTGLGLSMCREVIESHKGRIRVESAVGKGTMFTLKLPLAGSAAQPVRTQSATSGIAAPASPSIQKAG